MGKLTKLDAEKEPTIKTTSEKKSEKKASKQHKSGINDKKQKKMKHMDKKRKSEKKRGRSTGGSTDVSDAQDGGGGGRRTERKSVSTFHVPRLQVTVISALDIVLSVSLDGLTATQNASEYLALLERIQAAIDEHRATLGLAPYFMPLKRGGRPVFISAHSKVMKGARVKLRGQFRTSATSEEREQAVGPSSNHGRGWRFGLGTGRPNMGYVEQGSKPETLSDDGIVTDRQPTQLVEMSF